MPGKHPQQAPNQTLLCRKALPQDGSCPLSPFALRRLPVLWHRARPTSPGLRVCPGPSCLGFVPPGAPSSAGAPFSPVLPSWSAPSPLPSDGDSAPFGLEAPRHRLPCHRDTHPALAPRAVQRPLANPGQSGGRFWGAADCGAGARPGRNGSHRSSCHHAELPCPSRRRPRWERPLRLRSSPFPALQLARWETWGTLLLPSFFTCKMRSHSLAGLGVGPQGLFSPVPGLQSHRLYFSVSWSVTWGR